MSEPAAPFDAAGSLRIDRDGGWRHEDQEVTHAGVLQNLYANLRVEGEQHYLQVGPRRIPVAVDDAPFVVTRVELGPGPDGGAGESLLAALSDGTTETVAPESLWVDERGTPYCLVKSQRFRARLSVAAWLQLAVFVEEESGSERLMLVIGTQRVPIPRRV